MTSLYIHLKKNLNPSKHDQEILQKQISCYNTDES